MGPLVLLSLIGIGAATAVVDAMGTAEETDESNPQSKTQDAELNAGGDMMSPPAVGTSEQQERLPELSTDALLGTEESELLVVRGDGDIAAGGGDDSLVSWGSGDLLGQEGNDSFKIGGTVEGFGGEGEDYMHIAQAAHGFGGEGDDTFFLKASQASDGGASHADGGEGDDTFILQPLAGFPEDTLPHVLTGGAGADIYALDIDGATEVRPGEEDGSPVVARITDFDPAEDMLLVDIGATANMPELSTIPTPLITTSLDSDGGFTDVQISWENPLNPDNVETRTIRLEGVTDFSAEDVHLTNVYDPDSTHFKDQTDGAQTHRLFALNLSEGTDTDDVITVRENSAIALKGGDDVLTLVGGSHLADGGTGNDTLAVTSESNAPVHLFGGDGDDVITADLVQNNDTALFGGDGDDTITFGLGHYVDGNDGEDTFVLNIHADALEQGPAVLRTLTGNHLTLNIPAGIEGEVDIVNHTYGNGFEVAYSEIFIGDVPVLKLLEEDFENGVGIAEDDPRLTIVRDFAA